MKCNDTLENVYLYVFFVNKYVLGGDVILVFRHLLIENLYNNKPEETTFYIIFFFVISPNSFTRYSCCKYT